MKLTSKCLINFYTEYMCALHMQIQIFHSLGGKVLVKTVYSGFITYCTSEKSVKRDLYHIWMV